MIFSTSRYAGGVIVAAADVTGTLQTAIVRTPFADSTVLEQVQVDQNMRLDLIAQRLYGDPTLWWKVADANPSVPYPDEFTPGTLLNIPDASTN